MAEDKVIRRLAAIFAADMVGFSRLMEANEEGTIARQKAHRKELIDPKIAEHNGRIVKTTGDGLLAEFASAVDAVRCAVEIQRAVADREAGAPESRRIVYRTAVNVGDIVIDGDDIIGDGVNVAARLEALAPPGGLCISDIVFRSIEGKLDIAFEDAGARSVKNLQKPIHVWLWSAINGSREVETAGTGNSESSSPEQEIRFCKARDGARIAYATVGSGPAVLKTSNWLTHLELDWSSPLWRDFYLTLARRHTFVRYDHRGTGLSDWKVDEISFRTWVEDVEAVVAASKLQKFSLLGVSQGCATAIAFAARHPDMVSRLVLYGGFAKGWRLVTRGNARAQWEAMCDLTRSGWGQENPAFRQIFTTLFAPTASSEQKSWFDEIQKASATPENAARVQEAFGDIDIADLLDRITCPTLVMHCREDAIVPFEAGRQLASRIPNARFVALESKNHILFPEDPAWSKMTEETIKFLAGA